MEVKIFLAWVQRPALSTGLTASSLYTSSSSIVSLVLRRGHLGMDISLGMILIIIVANRVVSPTLCCVKGVYRHDGPVTGMFRLGTPHAMGHDKSNIYADLSNTLHGHFLFWHQCFVPYLLWRLLCCIQIGSGTFASTVPATSACYPRPASCWASC